MTGYNLNILVNARPPDEARASCFTLVAPSVLHVHVALAAHWLDLGVEQ